MIKFAGIEFNNRDEVQALLAQKYNQGQRYLVKCRRVYQIDFSAAQGLYTARELGGAYKKAGVPYTGRGRYMFADAGFINRSLGRDVVI